MTIGVSTQRVTCHAVPVQIEGTLTDGRVFYFRARWNTATLGIGDTSDEAVRDSFSHDEQVTDDPYGASCWDVEDALPTFRRMLTDRGVAP